MRFVAAGFVLQTLGLYLRGLAVKGCPIGNMFEIFQFTAWSAISLYLVIGATFRLSLLGYFTSCLSAVLTLVSLATPGWDATHRINAFGNTAWVELHAALALFSYGVFALLALASGMYLLQTYSLKHKQLHGLFSFLPSILELDLISVRLLVAGVVLMTWSLGIGAFHWLQDLSSVDTPKLLTAGVWLAYLLALLLRLGQETGLATPGLDVPGAVRRRPALPRTGQRQPPSGDAGRAAARQQAMSVRPTLFLLGASHQTAPLELREKLALAGGKLDALHGELQSLAGLQEFAVLNTCNRVEIYGVAAQAGGGGPPAGRPVRAATRWTRACSNRSGSSCTTAPPSSTSSRSPPASTRRWSARRKSSAR